MMQSTLSPGKMAFGKLDDLGHASQPSLFYWNNGTQASTNTSTCNQGAGFLLPGNLGSHLPQLPWKCKLRASGKSLSAAGQPSCPTVSLSENALLFKRTVWEGKLRCTSMAEVSPLSFPLACPSSPLDSAHLPCSLSLLVGQLHLYPPGRALQGSC